MTSGTEPVLTVDAICGGYGQVEVLHGVSLRMLRGETLGITGSNGAGKTSLVKAIMGLIRPTSGTVMFNGADITRRATHLRIRTGIALVPEGRQIFRSLSVEANLAVTVLSRRRVRLDADHRARIDRVYDTFPILGERRRQPAGQLSGGQQQMLAIGRALVLEPTLLVLDEPTQGLAPQLVEEVAGNVARLRGTLSILVVEQNPWFLEQLADSVVVMRQGQLNEAGTDKFDVPTVVSAPLPAEPGLT